MVEEDKTKKSGKSAASENQVREEPGPVMAAPNRVVKPTPSADADTVFMAYVALREDISRLEIRISGVESRISRVEARLDAVDARLDSLEKRFENLINKAEKIYMLLVAALLALVVDIVLRFLL